MSEITPGEMPHPTPKEEAKEMERYLRSKEGPSEEEIRKEKEMMEEEGKHLDKEYKESREGDLALRLTGEEARGVLVAVEKYLSNFHGIRSGSASPEKEQAYQKEMEKWEVLYQKLRKLIIPKL